MLNSQPTGLVDLGSPGATLEVDGAEGNFNRATLTADCTVSFANMRAGCFYILQVTQNVAGTWDLIFPVGVLGGPPATAKGNGAVTTYVFSMAASQTVPTCVAAGGTPGSAGGGIHDYGNRAGAVTLDAADGSAWCVTATANLVLSFAGLTPGRTYALQFNQDATGYWTADLATPPTVTSDYPYNPAAPALWATNYTYLALSATTVCVVGSQGVGVAGLAMGWEYTSAIIQQEAHPTGAGRPLRVFAQDAAAGAFAGDSLRLRGGLSGDAGVSGDGAVDIDLGTTVANVSSGDWRLFVNQFATQVFDMWQSGAGAIKAHMGSRGAITHSIEIIGTTANLVGTVSASIQKPGASSATYADNIAATALEKHFVSHGAGHYLEIQNTGAAALRVASAANGVNTVDTVGGAAELWFGTVGGYGIKIGPAGALGFFGTGPIPRPAAVPVTAAGIHAALVSLGLIT